MSSESRCYEIGIGGRCGETCEVYLDGECRDYHDQIIRADVTDYTWGLHKGMYRTILLDPPWWYADQKKLRKDGLKPTKGIGANHHYSLMREEALARLPIGDCAHPEGCHLYLWATMPLLDQAIRLIDVWGYTYATVAFTWVKTNAGVWREIQRGQVQFMEDPGAFLDQLTFFGPGYYTGSNIELVLLARKGKAYRHQEGHKASQVVYAPLQEHSRKPEAVQARIEWMYPEATPRLEVFARRPRFGWDVIGNEV